MIYLSLFWDFFIIGALSFGGGYASLPLLEQNIVNKQGWLTEAEFVDLLTLSEMTPGPIAINAATFAGNQVAGILGGMVATLGIVAPSLIIVLILATLYTRYKELDIIQELISGLQPAIVALIFSAALTILTTALFTGGDIQLSNVNWVNLIIFLAAFYLIRKYQTDPIRIMIITGLVGGLIFSLFPVTG